MSIQPPAGRALKRLMSESGSQVLIWPTMRFSSPCTCAWTPSVSNLSGTAAFTVQATPMVGPPKLARTPPGGLAASGDRSSGTAIRIRP